MSNKWKYYEGTTSANSIIRDLAKVFCTAVKDDPFVDGEGKVLKPSKVIQERNWDIVFPPVNRDAVSVVDWMNLTADEFAAKIDNQLSIASDTIILKTKTSAIDLDGDSAGTDEIGLENDLSTKSIDMFVELYKPRYLADPEKYHPEVERYGIKPYNVTRAIYEEFASTIGNKELNVLETWATDSNVILSNVTQSSGNRTASIETSGFLTNKALESNNAKLIRFVLEKSGYTVNTGFKEDVSMASTTRVLRSYFDTDDIKNIAENVTGIAFDDYENVVVSLTTTYVNSISKRYNLTLNFQRTKEVYRLASTFRVTLPDGDKVRPSTIKFSIGGNQQGDNVWSYNVTSGEFYLKANVPASGTLDPSTDGVPVITYEYNREQTAITGRKLLYNNHYIYMRMFDKIKPDMAGPIDNEIDEVTGEVMKINSHVSEWSKLSWYQDYEEVLVDELDSEVGVSDISKGVVFLPIETPGLNGDTRIRFWINTNNDRAIVALMGNPSLDFSTNRHLTSMMYVGKIESFENSINDTAGNFALFTSSSTVPCSTRTVTRRVTLPDSRMVGVGTFVDGDDSTKVQTYSTSLPRGRFFDQNVPFMVKFKDGDSINSLDNGLYSVSVSADRQTATVNLAIAPPLGIEVHLDFSYYQENIVNVEGIVRDGFGNILDIRYPDTWGKNTASGVTDVCMLHTRSKAYFQKHHFMFTTTEEYMTKEMYGKSAYTGEYYADRVKITHGNDGPRGMLHDVLVIDQSSLVALDELIVNREFSKDDAKPEETYVFFPINASFSPLAGSPNAMYGIAIKKSHKLPAPTSDEEAVQRAMDELYIGSLTGLREDIYLPSTSDNDVQISWESSDPLVLSIENI